MNVICKENEFVYKNGKGEDRVLINCVVVDLFKVVRCIVYDCVKCLRFKVG